jgi:hypothetical protein
MVGLELFSVIVLFDELCGDNGEVVYHGEDDAGYASGPLGQRAFCSDPTLD